MIDHVIDRVDAVAFRYRKLLMVVGGAWLLISWASNAHFIDLPDIPLLTGKTGVIASSGFAALWWALLNPRIQKRRLAREAQAAELGKAEVVL